MLYRALALVATFASAASFSPTAIGTHHAALTRRAGPAMQFGNALGGLNDELAKEMAGADDDEKPMTKAELKKLEKEALAEMKKLKDEAAAAEKAAKEAADAA